MPGSKVLLQPRSELMSLDCVITKGQAEVLAYDVAYKVVDFVNRVTIRIHIDLSGLHCQLKAIVTYESVLPQRALSVYCPNSARSVLMSVALATTQCHVDFHIHGPYYHQVSH